MPDAFKYSGERKSFQSFNEPYFWTSVIKDWKHLLKDDEMKLIVIQSFQWLKQNELVSIYGYVPINRDAKSYTCILGTIKDEWKEKEINLQLIHQPTQRPCWRRCRERGHILLFNATVCIFTLSSLKIIMKIYIFFLCLFFTLSGIGQKHSISINYKPSLTYFGRQTQSFHDSYLASRKGNKTFNSSANILYSYKLSPKISLTTGLEYSQQGQNISFNADSVFPGNNKQVLKIELNYFRIPFIINYSILKLKKSELNIYSGISIGIVAKRKDNYQNIILENILLPPAEKRFKNKDWGVPIGINYKEKLTSKTFIYFGTEYLLGLTNSFSENGISKFGVLSEFDNSKQSKLSLNIGIGFNLIK